MGQESDGKESFTLALHLKSDMARDLHPSLLLAERTRSRFVAR